ncbi:Putative TetR-family transcriptional regulator [hydrothermal vent metagenome]|uniref:TetR-family transcriptional regulator n=1 Tax=hydrothermal vent metagenome TaxID=652676 RepID=A0A3B0SAJ4_9ZZZZ
MNIGRPIEFDRAKALEQAQYLFWRKGYRDTSLCDLLRAMGLSKSSFYQAFNSKHDLFEQSIQLYLKERTTAMRAKLKASPSAFGFISDMLCGIPENSSVMEYRAGCMVMNTACEFAQSDEVIAKAVHDSITAFVKVFKEAVILGQQQGDIAPDKDPDALAVFLVTNMGGLNVSFKAGADPAAIERTAKIALSALK